MRWTVGFRFIFAFNRCHIHKVHISTLEARVCVRELNAKSPNGVAGTSRKDGVFYSLFLNFN